MGYGGYSKYVTAAEKKAKAEKTIQKLKKKNPNIAPIIIEGRTLAKTWWGKAWNDNLEGYADYSNRIGRGKTYVKSGAVLDLQISKGTVNALVQGSKAKPYEITIKIDSLESNKWKQILVLCNNRIDTLEELVEGKFPKELEVLFTEHKYGLFPSPDEIKFNCSCLDWAYMCKHVAAVLYGIGTRLDDEPMLFFELRDLDGIELIKKSVEKKIENMLKNSSKISKRQIEEKDVFDIFGI